MSQPTLAQFEYFDTFKTNTKPTLAMTPLACSLKQHNFKTPFPSLTSYTTFLFTFRKSGAFSSWECFQIIFKTFLTKAHRFYLLTLIRPSQISASSSEAQMGKSDKAITIHIEDSFTTNQHSLLSKLKYTHSSLQFLDVL